MTILRKNRFYQTALILGFSFILGVSCSKKKQSDDMEDGLTPSSELSDTTTMGDSDSGTAMGLQTVNFPYDSFTLDATAKNTIKMNAEIMKSNPALQVQVEGHCDARGGIQYNIALGEKRANAVRNYMSDMGVDASRVSTISYGKERLLDFGYTEEAHAKNRRANFVITSK